MFAREPREPRESEKELRQKRKPTFWVLSSPIPFACLAWFAGNTSGSGFGASLPIAFADDGGLSSGLESRSWARFQ